MQIIEATIVHVFSHVQTNLTATMVELGRRLALESTKLKFIANMSREAAT